MKYKISIIGLGFVGSAMFESFKKNGVVLSGYGKSAIFETLSRLSTSFKK